MQGAATATATAPASRPTGGAGGLAAANVAGQLLGFVTAPLLARVLGPAARGDVALIGIYDEVSTNVCNAGVPSAVGYATKEGTATVPALLGAARRFAFLALPFSVLAAWAVVRWPLASLDAGPRAVAFALVALSPFANTFLLASRNVLVARGDLRTLRRLPVVQAAARLLLVVALAAVGWLGIGTAALAISGAALVANAVAWRRLATRAGPPAPLRPLLAFGVRAVPGTLANLANNRLDQLLVGPMLGSTALGLYAVAVGVTFLPVQLGSALALGLFHRVRPGQLGPTDAAATAVRRAWVVVGAACAATAVATVLGLELVYGHDFAGAVTPTLLLLPGTWCFGVHLTATQVANAVGRPEHGSAGQLAGLAVTVVGLVVVLPEGGIAAAAVVSSLAYAARLALTLWLLRREGVRGTRPSLTDVRDVARRGRPRGARRVGDGATPGARSDERSR